MIVKLKDCYVNMDHVMTVHDQGYRMTLRFPGPVQDDGSNALILDGRDREIVVTAIEEVVAFQESDLDDLDDDDEDDEPPDAGGPIIDVSSFGCDGEF